jgi:hypothetical protein
VLAWWRKTSLRRSENREIDFILSSVSMSLHAPSDICYPSNLGWRCPETLRALQLRDAIVLYACPICYSAEFFSLGLPHAFDTILEWQISDGCTVLRMP